MRLPIEPQPYANCYAQRTKQAAAERRLDAAGVRLGTAGHWQIRARRAVRRRRGAGLRVAAGLAARARGPDRRAADRGQPLGVLPAADDRAGYALPLVRGRAERLLL